MHLPEGHIAATFGLVLAAALLAGLLADYFRLPKVTAYLLVGILLGPSGLDLLAAHHIETFDPLTQLAMALVLFNLGCHFPLEHVRRILPRVTRLSLGELTATFVLVGGGLLLVGQTWPVAVLLAALALATAPATTVLVLKETESEGPVTECTSALLILNNFASIVIFELIFLAVHLIRGEHGTPMPIQLGLLARDIGGSLALGVAAGVVVSYCCGLVDPSRWLVLLVAATTLLLGLDEILEVPYMLSFLAMGLAVANASDVSKKIVAELNRLTSFLCVIFFVVHGAELDLSAFAEAGFIGAAYIVFRSAGKYLGIFVSARMADEPASVRNWGGAALVAQAGAAIALSAVAAQRDPELGEQLQTIILGTVVFFEIAGPLLIRQAVLRSGEVPLAHAVRHSSSTLLEELRALSTRILVSLGRDPLRKRKPDELRVSHFMRRNVAVLNESSSFDEVVTLIAHSHDNSYPVLDNDSCLVGVVRYTDLSQVLFDREVTRLVYATDLARPVKFRLHPDDSISKALRRLRETKDDSVVVVAPEEPHTFVGLVRRRDLTTYLLRQQETSEEPEN